MSLRLIRFLLRFTLHNAVLAPIYIKINSLQYHSITQYAEYQSRIYLSLSFSRYSLSALRFGTHQSLKSIRISLFFWHTWVNTSATPVVRWVNSYQDPAPNQPREEEIKLQTIKVSVVQHSGLDRTCTHTLQKKNNQNKLKTHQKRTGKKYIYSYILT